MKFSPDVTSANYVKYAKRHLKRWSRINLTVGNAEALPVPDESQDAVTSIFLFHELPPKVRRIAFRECVRALSVLCTTKTIRLRR